MSDIIPLPPPPRFKIDGSRATTMGRDEIDRDLYAFEVDSLVQLVGSLEALAEVGYYVLACVASIRVGHGRAPRPRGVARLRARLRRSAR